MIYWEQIITTFSVLFALFLVHRNDWSFRFNLSTLVAKHHSNASYPITPSLIDCSRHYLFIVLSSSSGLNHRIAIRTTWAQPNLLAKNNATLFFLLGHHNNSTDYQQYESEAFLFGDILVDASKSEINPSQTSQAIRGLSWAIQQCSLIPVIVKLDDTTFIQWTAFHRAMITHPPHHPAIWGHVILHDVPLRDPSMESHFISEEDFPMDVFPKYIKGPMYCMSNAAVVAMMLAVKNFPLDSRHFPRDDVFLTGLLAVAANVERYHQKYFNCYLSSVDRHAIPTFPQNKTSFVKSISINKLMPSEMRYIQREIDGQREIMAVCDYQTQL